MYIVQETWTPWAGWQQSGTQGTRRDGPAQLVLFFATPGALAQARPLDYLRTRHPEAQIVGCSTRGGIAGIDMIQDGITAIAVSFAQAQVAVSSTTLTAREESQAVGAILAAGLPATMPAGELRAVFTLADGVAADGCALTKGLLDELPPHVLLTGGLAGGGMAYGDTLTGHDEDLRPGRAVAVGFYGPSLVLGWGSGGGWEKFGPERLVTRSQGGEIQELNGQPSLDLYLNYLGEEAANLPQSALLFPLSIHPAHSPQAQVVRTVTGVDFDNRSLSVAGEIPPRAVAQLMRGNFNALSQGARTAAIQARQVQNLDTPCLALLVSCVGRQFLMGQRTADEIEAVADELTPKTIISGFYSNGEIAPPSPDTPSCFHNQTMTITTIGEKTETL